MAFKSKFKSKRSFKKRPMKRYNMKKAKLSRAITTASVNLHGKHFFTRWQTINNTQCTSTVSGGVGAALSFTAANDGWDINTGTTSAITYISAASYFAMDQLPGFSAYTTNYDQYKIISVLYKITPYSTNVEAQFGTSTAPFNNQPLSCILHYARDYDDVNLLSASNVGINALRNRIDYRSRNLFQSNGKPIYIKIKPRIAMAGFGSGIFNSYTNQKSQWIDSNSPSVQHYGLKMIFETFQPDTTVPCFIWFKMEAKYMIECRAPI